MDTRDKSIQKYMAFVETVRTGSFTKAAEKLHYSQSGISRMIGDLEREWKVTLLERDRAGVTLTSDGKALLPHVTALIDEYSGLQSEVDSLCGLESGIIRIATFSSVATHWLPKIITEFQRDYPGIRYELLMGDYGEIEGWVRDGSADCGFTRLPASDGLEGIFLEDDPYMAVLPRKHRLAQSKEFPIEAFADEPFLMLEQGSNTEVAKILADAGVAPDVRFSTWDDYSIMSMVESGLGIAILPKLIMRRTLYKVVSIPLSTHSSRSIGLVLKNKDSASAATKKFLDYLKYR